MFGKFSVLTFIAAVALIVAAAPAPVAAQVEGYAVVGYGFQSDSNRGYGASSGPLLRAGALYRIVKPLALGGEIGHYWLGEAAGFDLNVERDRILAFAFCIELGKPRRGISPRVALGASRSSISRNSVYTSIEGKSHTFTSSRAVIVPHLGLVMIGKPGNATPALRAEVRTAFVIYAWNEEAYWLNSVSVGLAF